MRKERGWTEVTIRSCCNTIDRFFDWLGEWGIALDAVVVADIDRAVMRWHGLWLQSEHDPHLRAATAHFFPVRRTPGLVYTGAG